MERIHQQIALAGSPQRVYEALTKSERFGRLTGQPADIDAREGGSFSLFGGMITGRNVELVPGQRVVQAWRAGNWEPGVYSVVRFELMADGQGTRLELDQAGFPPGQGEHLAAGWEANYWGPLRQSLP